MPAQDKDEKTAYKISGCDRPHCEFIDDIPALVCRFLPDGTLVFVNSAYCRFFGRTPEELIGRDFFHLIPEDERQDIRANYQSLTPEKPVISYEHRVLDKDGKVCWQHWTDRAIFNKAGVLTEYQSVGQDITRRKETEERLKSSQEEIKKLYWDSFKIQEEDKRRVSHDLHDETGQMVIGVKSFLNLARKGLKKGQAKEAAEAIGEAEKIIQEMASKMKFMAFAIRPPSLDLLGLSAALREYFSRLSKSSSAIIKFTENLKDTKLNGDAEIAMYRIAQEAVGNAIKHSHSSDININLVLKDRTLSLLVRDSGVGFDVAKLDKAASMSQMGVRGIRERVTALGGTFSIESNPSRGTRLHINIPIEESSGAD